MAKIAKKIINFLDKEGIKYEIIEHKTAFTAYDRAETNLKRKIKPAEVVKALVLKVDREYVLALIPARKMLDKNKFKKIFNKHKKQIKEKLKKEIKKVGADKKLKKMLEQELKKVKLVKKIDLAKEAWMKKNVLGKIGATPPFSELTKLAIFIDGSLLRQKKLYLGSGEYDFSIQMTPAQYLKLEKELIKGSFNLARKKK